MKHWNYRLILHDSGDQMLWWVGLHEVYYDEQDEIVNWTELPITFQVSLDDYAPEEARDDVILSLTRALKNAQEKPMLKLSDLIKIGEHGSKDA